MPRAKWGFLWVGAVLGAWLAAGSAQAGLITFDGLGHGEVVDQQIEGVTVSAVNRVGGPNLAVAFSTRAEDSADPDLEFPGGDLGNVLIVQESDDSCALRGPVVVCADPDDEGRRRRDGTPSGLLVLEFAHPVSELGFVLIDVESAIGEAGFVSFLSGGNELLSMGFDQFIARDGAVYGDHSVNEIAPIDLRAFDEGGMPIDEVRFALGGSGAIDEVRFSPAPEPASAALLGLGLAALGRAGRPRRGRQRLRRSRSSK